MGMTKPTRVLVASFPDREPGNGSGARERIQAGRHTGSFIFPPTHHPPHGRGGRAGIGHMARIWNADGLATAEEAHGHTMLLGQ